MRNLILASCSGRFQSLAAILPNLQRHHPRMSVRLGLRLLHRAWVAVAAVSRLKVWESGRSHISLPAPVISGLRERDNSSDRPCKTDYGRFNIFASWSSAGADEYEYKVKVWNTATGTIGPNIRWADVEKTVRRP